MSTVTVPRTEPSHRRTLHQRRITCPKCGASCLDIRQPSRGRRFICYGGCDMGVIMRQMGLRWTDLMPSSYHDLCKLPWQRKGVHT